MSAALYIDGAALFQMHRSLGLGRADIKQLLVIAEELAGPIEERYWFDASPENRRTGFHAVLTQNGFHVNLGCLTERSFTDRYGVERTEQKQQGVDVDLAVTAISSHHQGKWNHLVLVAADGDFEPLVRRLDVFGCRITLISTRAARSPRLLPYVKSIDLEEFADRLRLSDVA